MARPASPKSVVILLRMVEMRSAEVRWEGEGREKRMYGGMEVVVLLVILVEGCFEGDGGVG